ncbi:M23 family metallopeptidase [Dactylosporangium vinaceum]|uniref:Peptidoglycan DD-metalloendopeptidase family protein n=1 Tax=Dactylosporangium vinaceum TaxID=53362 RepID=A0ABV5MB19_9ACTN|nr:peptidoglycan DD-metalloendopeptidase family protein [Dactylosporangium vinaceum]UAB98266.1 M23 family metallopeptidase [Dactylosporangium vinaceum]
MRKTIFAAAVAATTTAATLLIPVGAQAATTATVVSPKRPLNVRAGAAVWTRPLRTLPNGTAVSVECQVKGQLINQGPVRVTDQWDRLTDGSFVSDAWVRHGQQFPPCTDAQTVAAPAAAAAPATAATTAGTVASGAVALKTRSGPARAAVLYAGLANGTPLNIVCQLPGEQIAGTMRVTDRWDRLDTGAYVSDAYVNRATAPPSCDSLAAPAPAAAAPAPAAEAGQSRWVSPLPGFSARPGFRTPTNPNHVGVDIMSFVGTPIHAASAGTVVEVVCNIEAGHSCDQAGSAAIGGCGWYVKIQHAGGVSTLYCHMVRRGVVQAGQKVAAGQVIGYVGSSGNSSAPHLHFEVHVSTPPTSPGNAVDPLPFMRAHSAAIG